MTRVECRCSLDDTNNKLYKYFIIEIINPHNIMHKIIYFLQGMSFVGGM